MKSLKAVLLFNGNQCTSIPVGYSVEMKETYENMKSLLLHLNYSLHEWLICEDIKVISILLGQQAGYTKYPCFRCLWDSRADHLHFVQIMRKSLENWKKGIRVGGRIISNLRYADDTTLVANSKDELEQLLTKLKEESEKAGLHLNLSKTKVMTTGQDVREATVGGENLETVQSYIFLGSMVTNNGECMQEIRRRLALGRTAVRNMEQAWKDVSTGTKLEIMERMVFPIVSYGAESWVLRKKNRKTIDAFELWAYRRMLRIPWIQRKTNYWIIEKYGILTLCSAKFRTDSFSTAGTY